MITFRKVEEQDIPFLAQLRAQTWETEDFWTYRIAAYLDGSSNPQKARKQRIAFVALQNETIVGFIAGHLTIRFHYDGELEWIDVNENNRNKGIGSELVKVLAHWFIENEAYNICVDPGNDLARKFYRKNGAVDLNNHWMFWEDIRKIKKATQC